MMALAGVELETLVSEPDALTTRPPTSFYVAQMRVTTVQTKLKRRIDFRLDQAGNR